MCRLKRMYRPWSDSLEHICAEIDTLPQIPIRAPLWHAWFRCSVKGIATLSLQEVDGRDSSVNDILEAWRAVWNNGSKHYMKHTVMHHQFVESDVDDEYSNRICLHRISKSSSWIVLENILQDMGVKFLDKCHTFGMPEMDSQYSYDLFLCIVSLLLVSSWEGKQASASITNWWTTQQSCICPNTKQQSSLQLNPT